MSTLLEEAQDKKIQRLLELYPVASLDAHWQDVEGVKEDRVKTIAEQRQVNLIKRFLIDHFSCSKQHIYIFSHEIADLGKLPEDLLSDLPDTNTSLVHATSSKDRRTYLYLLDLRFTLILRNPLGSATLAFLWPFKVEFDRYYMAAKFTILEKKFNRFYPERRASLDRRNINEEKTNKHLMTKLSNYSKFGQIDTLDLNKGTKELWEDDAIDARRVEYQKAKSTSVETMDEDFLLKRVYPNVYQQALRAPLYKTIFEVLSQASRLTSTSAIRL